MKVAFVEPAIMNVEPLGIAYLTQVLINDGHEVRYFEYPRKNFFRRVKDFNPNVLAYSITTGKHRLCRNLNLLLRNQIKAISLFGGPHCTFFPEFIQSDDLIDGICQGEGEYALVELLRKIEKGQDYSGTPNWWLRVKGGIYKNPVREKIADLDSIPFPNREVIYAENHELRDTPIKRVLGSRGCPFVCSYCFNKRYNDLYQGKGAVYRQRSPLNIVQEVKEIQRKYSLTFLKFAEDIFDLEMDNPLFLDIYSREVRIPFICNVRPNMINEDKAKQLKKAGCVAVTMAVESANDFIRNKILNRNLSSEILNETVEILKCAKIRVWTQNIIANPGETFETALQTFNFNVKHKVDFAECFILTPFPGTMIYEYCVKNNLFDGRVEALPDSYWLDSVIRFDSIREKNQLINFQKFFSFGVQHPKALPIIKMLIKLPPNNLFVFFNRLYDSWRTYRVLRAKFKIVNFIEVVINNIRYILTYFFKKERQKL